MARSYYLDDMHLVHGQQVLCKASIACLHITAGKTYRVEKRDCGSRHDAVMGIINDAGEWCIPSARFQKV